MHIEKIIINNYKIYYGENILVFPSLNSRNVCVISGNNGYGKTTLLTALVWCLYGNQIQDVDEFFKDRVTSDGGYRKFLYNCLNRYAFENNETVYSVSICLKEVELPGIYCDTIQISRSFDINKSSDSLRILIDGNPSELFDDIAQQLFIQDFILPKEIAKLFFFDAEKIVRLAEVQSLHEKRLLSQAYSEVLGIKKYEDLRNNLSDLMMRFRKESASEKEKAQFDELGKEIRSIERMISSKGREKERIVSLKNELISKADDVQEKLLREGNTLTISEINNLKEEKSKLEESIKSLKNDFKELFELAPFAIMGKLLIDIENQIDIEDTYNRSIINQDNIKQKIQSIIDALNKDDSKIANNIDQNIKEYYAFKVNELAHELLIETHSSEHEDVVLIHNYNIETNKRFKALLSNLRTSYKEKLQILNLELKSKTIAYNNVSRILTNAESKETDPLVIKYREERKSIATSLGDIDEKAFQLGQDMGSLENELILKNKVFEDLAKKIRVDGIYAQKDQLVTRLIEELDNFLKIFKTDKKKSLENKILKNIQLLMHKKDFIGKVTVIIPDDYLDILLFDVKGKEIRKEDLSKGEQQLYATALLKALVEESGIDFPVIIDSPLQKFDDKHSENIITIFYPKVSKQVILLPLKDKELSQREYSLLLKHIECVYTIDNRNNSSSFRKTVPKSLMSK